MRATILATYARVRHSDIRTTMNIYGAAMTDSKRQAHSKVVKLVIAGAGGARA